MKPKMISFIVFGLGVAATVLLMLKAFSFEGEVVISGFKLAFGGELDFGSNISINAGKFKFNILFVLILVLPALAGVIQTFVTEPFGSVTAIVMFVVAIILALTIKETKFVVNVINSEITLKDLKLETFGIISVVLSGIGALLSGHRLIEHR